MKLSDYQVGKKFMGLFKGRSKSGKTIGAVSFWEMCPDQRTYIFDLDNRLESIFNFYNRLDPAYLKELIAHIDYDTFKPTEFVQIDQKVRQLKMSNPYGLIICDGLTSWGKVACAYARSLKGVSAADDKKKGQGKKIGVIEVPGLEEFNAESQSLKELLDFAIGANSHFILTAHLIADDQYSPEGELVKTTRDILSGARRISAMVPAYFNEDWLFDTKLKLDPTKEPERVIWTTPYDGAANGTSWGLPPEILWTRANLFRTVQSLRASENGATPKENN